MLRRLPNQSMGLASSLNRGTELHEQCSNQMVHVHSLIQWKYSGNIWKCQMKTWVVTRVHTCSHCASRARSTVSVTRSRTSSRKSSKRFNCMSKRKVSPLMTVMTVVVSRIFHKILGLWNWKRAHIVAGAYQPSI